MKPNPCRPDCPRRSGECHAGCKEYAEFRADREQFNRDRQSRYISKWCFNDAAIRALRKKLNAYKRNH